MSLVEIRDVTKNYGGLRPFRLRRLDVEGGELTVLAGIDRQAASVLTDLLTGTTLPDGPDGAVTIDGRPTFTLGNQDEWLTFLDRFGIVNERVVLLDELSIAANLAVPLTLDVDPMAPELRVEVERLADEVGIDLHLLGQRLSGASPMTRLRVRLGRALAHNPSVLLVEHPTVELRQPREVASTFDVLRKIVERRRLAAVVPLADPRVPKDKATRFLTWDAASGDLSEPRGWRRWWS